MKSTPASQESLLKIQRIATKALEEADNLPQVIETIIPRICILFGWDFGAYWEIKGGRQACSQFVWTQKEGLADVVEETKGICFDIGIGLPGKVLDSAKTLWMSDVFRETPIPRIAFLKKAGLRTAVGVPLIYRKQVIGICEFFGSATLEKNEEFITIISNIGIQIGQFAAYQETIKHLAENEERVRTIIQSALDAVVVADATGIITQWNPQAQKMFGWTAEEAIGKQMSHLIIPQQYRAAHKAGMARYLDTGETRIMNKRVELTALNREGSEFPIELTVTSQKYKNQIYFTAYMRDITERLFFESQLANAIKIAEENQSKAEAANNAKSEFLATMSHEIRTPMNAIVGMSDLMARECLSDQQKEYVDVIQVSADNLLSLINDLLDYTKIEAGHLQLSSVPFSFGDLVRNTATVLNRKAQGKGLELVISNDPDNKLYLGDPVRLRQVIMNLCDNAIKFTNEGSVKLHISSKPVNDCETVTIVVSDTGIGIPKKKQQAIFEKFTQADSTVSRHYGGTGLGLAITKALVNNMSGSIDVKSKPGHGATFTVKVPLPLARESLSDKQPASVDQATKPYTGKTCHVLIVEDHEPNVLVTKKFLEQYNCTYEVARSGKEALDRFRKNDFGMILMDIQMPGMDGLETTSRIRAIESKRRDSRTPIIGVTAHALAGDREHCLQAGMDDYLAKPFKAEALKEKLEMHR